jgi:hypothetical protein
MEAMPGNGEFRVQRSTNLPQCFDPANVFLVVQRARQYQCDATPGWASWFVIFAFHDPSSGDAPYTMGSRNTHVFYGMRAARAVLEPLSPLFFAHEDQ